MERQFRWQGRHAGRWLLGGRTFYMGVLNVTPDSFSDGNLWLDAGAAAEQAATLVASGADLLDIGGESTRPGHVATGVEEEWRRIAPVLERVGEVWDLPISVDTRNPEVARRATQAGVEVINDIWGGRDPEMVRVLADTGAGLVLMFNREPPFAAGELNLEEMRMFFQRRLAELSNRGIEPERVLIDPGLGFGYEVEDNWEVLRGLQRFTGMGAGLLLGPSRKRFLGTLTGLAPRERDMATAACCALAIPYGVDVVRVHNVALTRQAALVADRWYRT